MILNAGGISSSSWLDTPKVMTQLFNGNSRNQEERQSNGNGENPNAITILEFYLRKLKSLSKKAVNKYGKGYEGNREAIMVVIMSNDKDIDSVERFLVHNQYFKYVGVVCLTQNVTPNLNSFGKIQLIGGCRVNLSSGGSGGLLSRIRKDKIFDTWIQSGVEYVNILGITDLGNAPSDPISFAFLKEKGYEIMAN